MRRALLGVVLSLGCGAHTPATRPAEVTIKPIGGSVTAPVPPAATEPAESPLQVGLTSNRICVRSEGKVYCQAQGSFSLPLVQESLRVSDVDDAIDFSSGNGFDCILRRRGNVVCAGTNASGQLGAGLVAEANLTFLDVKNVANARKLAGGEDHTCAILEDKSVRCWGDNSSGQTGSDTHYLPAARELALPQPVPNIKALELAANRTSTCVRTPDRRITCWGTKQDLGAVRTGTGSPNERPTAIPDLDDIDALAASDYADGYCVLRRGQLLCWGRARRLFGSTDPYAAGVAPIDGLKDVAQVALGSSHGCLLHLDGRVSCFGYPYSDALGTPPLRDDDPKKYDVVPPAVVQGLPRARAVLAGSNQSCAITRQNELYCWGKWYVGGSTHEERTPALIPLH